MNKSKNVWHWVMNLELWVFSTKEQKNISLYAAHSSKPRLSDVLVRRSQLTAHCSQLIAQNVLCLILLARLARFAWVKASDAARRRPYLSKLTTHGSLLTTQKSVVFASSACHCLHLSKKKKKGFWTEWRKSKNRQPSYSQANTKPWKTLRKHAKKRLKCFLSFT